jgi:low affinity Fe/Cu permease
MKNTYWQIEHHFERFTALVIKIIGNSITFIFAFIVILFWILNRDFYAQNIHDDIGDIILGITFLTLFILQKAFNKFTASIHLKINELVATHETASNLMINVENKTEYELKELSKEFFELALIANEEMAQTKKDDDLDT